MKKIVFVLLLLLTITLTSCDKNDEPYNIGFIGTLSGKYAEVGINTMYGVQLAVDEINEAGGINGRLIELHIRDDKADSDEAVAMQNELKELNCHVIIGHSLSIVAVDAIHNANNNEILLLSPSIGTDLVTNIDDNMIRLVATVYYESTVISEQMNESNPSKVMIITNDDNETLTRYHKEAFVDYFNENGFDSENIITTSFFSDNTEEINAVKELIVSENPDAILIASSNTDAAPLVNYIKGLDEDIDIHLTSWAGTNIIQRIDSVDTSNIYVYNDSATESTSVRFVEHKNTFSEIYGQDPDMLSINGYDAVYIIYDAIMNTSDYNYLTIKNYIIEKESFIGINDTFEINEFGDNKRSVYKYVIIDGELELVE